MPRYADIRVDSRDIFSSTITFLYRLCVSIFRIFNKLNNITWKSVLYPTSSSFSCSAPGIGEDSSWFLCYNATSHGWKAKTFQGYTDIPWGKILFDCLSTCTFKRALVPRLFHDTLKYSPAVVPCNRVMISIIALALFVLYNGLTL